MVYIGVDYKLGFTDLISDLIGIQDDIANIRLVVYTEKVYTVQGIPIVNNKYSIQIFTIYDQLSFSSIIIVTF